MADEGIIARFTSLFRKKGIPTENEDPPRSTATAKDYWVDWLESFGVDPSRTATYAEVEAMNRESPVIAAALDALADASVSGADGEAEDVFTVVFPDRERAARAALADEPTADPEPLDPPRETPGAPKPVVEDFPFQKKKPVLDAEAAEPEPSPEELEIGDAPPDEYGEAGRIFDALEERTQLKKAAWQQIRGFLMYGDEMAEVVIDARTKEVARLKGLPPQSIVAVPDRLGELRNEYAYRQHDETGRMIATFQPWQIVHFADRERTYDVYGRSHLAAVRRIFKQLSFVTDAMVVNRLTRSTMRYVHKIPTGNLNPVQATKYVDDYQKQFVKKRSFDSRGKLKVESKIWGEETDFFIPSGKDATGDVTALQGQNGFDKIEDVNFFLKMLFAGLRIPPAFVGFESEGGDRSIVTGLDVAFGRVVRRAQQTHGSGMRQVYQTELVLRGKDPAKVPFRFKYPALGTVDEMREWQVMLLKAQVAQTLKAGILITDDDYLLRKVLEVEEEDVARIIKANKSAEQKKAAEMQAQLDAKASPFGGGGGKFGGAPKPGAAAGPKKPTPFAQRGADDARGVRPKRQVTERIMRARGPASLERAVETLLRRGDVRRQLHEMRSFSRPLVVESGGVSPGAAALLRAGGVG